jgi:apoptotic protease-activating factor
MHQINELKSHKRSITNLQFSPWTEPNDPLILLSLSDSVIFWNIRSIQNNPLDLKRKSGDFDKRIRVSQRFKFPKSQLSPSPSETLLSPIQNLSLKQDYSNPWNKKSGSLEKPEMLSCIKLVAKMAKKIVCSEDFTRFVTIDNEGNIYYLRLVKDNTKNQMKVDTDASLGQNLQ